MSLLEIDKRIKLIKEAKKENRKAFLHDLGYVIFYGTNAAYVTAKSPKGKGQQQAKEFHKTMQKILDIDESESTMAEDPEQTLVGVFGK